MKKFAKLAAAAILLNLVHPYSAVSAVKAGATCSKVGSNAIQAGRKFTCVKSGKKLIWNKGVSLPKPVPTPTPSTSSAPANTEQTTVAPTPTPSPTPTQEQETKPASQQYSSPTEPSSSIEICKIKEKNANRERWADSQLPTGFPMYTHAQKFGSVKWALIPLDFPDLVGETNFRSRVDTQMTLLSDWYRTVSDGKFNIEWVVLDKWVRLPNPTSDYAISRSDNIDRVPNGLKLWNQAMTESDKVFDFTGIQTVNFILPSGQNFVIETSQGFPWDAVVRNFKTNEGSVSSFSLAGKFMDQQNRQYWSYWAHEFGHAMALPHVGGSRDPNPFQGLDLMGSQDGESRELSGWLRFVAGWLNDEKVYCQPRERLNPTEITLVPLSHSYQGLKMVVVPLTDTKALIVAS